ncbi:Piwi domain-containing protein [Aequorivita sp. SDUM287046]|uniref:Protein argonaute n=1 Tax=Aequorivita aurantiaca TaxID=3053356 RepID=A0ABT8DF12_9FLAO|nr:Piwi domain-containing protein [Aequorivita aurantiaca]MDN3723911.1 Piwi domain-containing protein [Aequorivita aurantiaca]
MENLCFNILTFEPPQNDLTLYFSNIEDETLNRVYHTKVPDEVIERFEKQEHYYTSFDKEAPHSFPVTKLISPAYETRKNIDGEDRSYIVQNSAWSISILKRYFNAKIHEYFKNKEFLVKPNFIHDTEIWIPSQKFDSTGQFDLYDRYCIKVQFKTVTKQLELLVTFEGVSKVYKESVEVLQNLVSPTAYNWVIFENELYRFEELPDAGKRAYGQVFPVWNFRTRDALGETTGAPDKSNKYIKFKKGIDLFYAEHLDNKKFRAIIPITSNGFIRVPEIKIGKVRSNSNQLLFGNNKTGIVPMNGLKDYGPYGLSNTTKIHFFFIFHKRDQKITEKIDSFFQGKEKRFSGLYQFIRTTYHTEPNFSIRFKDLDNPWPEIYAQLTEKHFEPDIRYIAIYISPYSKNSADISRRRIYYQLKELLLKKGISSQVIDAEKAMNNANLHYSLPNIAIAILAKLKGIPWRLDNTLEKELVVGVGAFKNYDFDIKYIGSAFSFFNNGQFNRFECFRQDQTKELAGSIKRAVKEYASNNPDIKRLIIHFYKTMRRDELAPIEEGLRDLELEIPVFIVSINKTESSDIVAFDLNWKELMPLSGTFINIGFNKFLLFNNTRYNNGSYNFSEGFPFPIKLKIECTHRELAEDIKVVRELIDQVYQFSRLYWKSVRQQNLPVTIKYPEMVAEMLPHFDGNEIPEFGKDNLWFL